jgi:Flp pilus assembly pilin Flp
MSERIALEFNQAILRLANRDFKREEGQGVTEYGIVLAFVAVALAAVLIVLKSQIQNFITQVGNDLANLPSRI